MTDITPIYSFGYPAAGDPSNCMVGGYNYPTSINHISSRPFCNMDVVVSTDAKKDCNTFFVISEKNLAKALGVGKIIAIVFGMLFVY